MSIFTTSRVQGPPSVVVRLLGFNWTFLLPIVLIAAIGVAALFSAAGGSFEPWAVGHVVRLCLGFGFMFLVAVTDIRVWLRAAYPFYVLALLLLVAVPFIGAESGGARRWLAFGPLSLQPAELMKVALIMALARYYQTLPPQYVSRPLALVLPALMILVPSALVIVQPDLGTAILFVAIGAGLVLLGGVSWTYFILAACAVVIAAPHVWHKLHDYQRERIMTFLEPGRDPLGAGYHILQSKIALGSGGIAGKGFMQGTQSHLNFLPEKHTDFIFTMFAEEMGFIGAAVLLALYLFVLLSIVYMAIRCRNPFGRLMAGGVGIMLFVYVFINVAMVTGLVPVVGVPLPLVSYGGTSILTVMIGFGLVLNAHLHRRVEFARADVGGML